MNREEKIIAVQKAQEYVENHLLEPITLRQLASAAGYSPWHLSRIFAEIAGKTPYEYIRSRRLTEAALVLRDENRRVLDVALDFVFDSQEGFTRAFSREFGISPGRYHNQYPAIPLFTPEKVYDNYRLLKKLDSRKERVKDMAKTIFVQVIERPERKCLLKRGIKATEYFGFCEEAGCEIWPVLTSVKEALYEPVGMWLPKWLRPEGTSEYVQGVELPLDYDKPVPEGYELVTFPAEMMMVFQGEPYDDENFMDEIDVVWQHIEQFNPQVYGYEWAGDTGIRFQLMPVGERGYIEARPVRKIEG